MGAGATLKTACWGAIGALDGCFRFSQMIYNKSNAVLMYHSVGEPGNYGNVSTARFRKTLAYLTDAYDIIDLPEVLSHDFEKKVALTFDDGWENFYRHALPILREFDVPATVFLVPDYIDSEPMLSASQVEELVECPLTTIGNHTKSHPHLSRIGNEQALEEQILAAQQSLNERFDTEITRFSYPRGDWNHESAEMVRESHKIGVTTMPRVINERYLGGELDHALVPRIPAHVSESRVRWELTDASSRIRQFASEVDMVTR